MFSSIKLFFTNREKFNECRRYHRLQREYRAKMKRQANKFCTWSGWYFNEMVKTMLEFYHKTYSAGDCCWSEKSRLQKIANQTGKALQAAEDLATYEDLEVEELLKMAQAEPGFVKFLEKWEKKNDLKVEREPLLHGIACDYYEKKYTTMLYDTIGKHVWEWCD